MHLSFEKLPLNWSEKEIRRSYYLHQKKKNGSENTVTRKWICHWEKRNQFMFLTLWCDLFAYPLRISPNTVCEVK